MKERILTNIEPRQVFKYFEDLTFIPRESENEEAVSEYLVDFAKEHGLEWSRDEAFNVIIRKAASPGYEDHPGVIMQAHVDMVCAKNPGVEFDFAKESIVFKIDGDRIIAEDTTLGADDGSGVAFILAVLADPEFKHPEIEAIFTTVEETGLFGVEKVDFSQIKGHYVINIDAADEGVAVIGCAGSNVICSKLPCTKVSICADEFYKISLFGLLGGHSGEDIHRGRASAIKELMRVLVELDKTVDYDLCSFRGGDKANSIPRTAEAVVAIDAASKNELEAFIEMHDGILKKEYHETDANISLKLESVSEPMEAMNAESQQRIIDFINYSDAGIVRMDQDLSHLVESSVNIGAVRTKGEYIDIWHVVRSSRESQMTTLSGKIKRLTEMLGGEYSVPAGNPPWQGEMDSQILKIYEDVYRELFGKEAERMIIHAALEPCKIAPRIDRKLDMIALGPDIKHPHAPGEYMTISSCQKLWITIKELLARL